MALFSLPDPITGLVSQHSTARNIAIWVHCGVYTLGAFLTTTGTTATSWFFQVHDMRVAAFLGVANGLIAAGAALIATWKLNAPSWLKAPVSPDSSPSPDAH